MRNVSLIIMFLQFAFDNIHKVFEKRNGNVAPLPLVVHQEQQNQRIASKTLEMNSASNKVRCVVDLCAYAYETVSFIGRVLSETNVELQLEVGGHVLACLVSCVYAQNKQIGCSNKAKSIPLTIITYPRPVRYAIKYTVGRRELRIINQEQTDHGGVFTERCLKSLANFCVHELNCKRTDFIVSVIIFLAMDFLMVLHTCQQDNPATFDLTFTAETLTAFIKCLMMWLNYRMSKDECEWIIVACETQKRVSDVSVV